MTDNKDIVYNWGIEFSKFSPRIPGTENIDNARDYITEKLKSFNIETWLEPINFRGVFHKDWELIVKSPENRTITSYPENNVGFGDLDTELVDIGKGTEKDYKNMDVKGKIVLINWGTLLDHELPCGTKKRYPLLASYDAAWVHEAAGMVGYFEDTPGNSLKILEPGIKATGGSNISGPAEIGEERQYQIPALNIGMEDAKYLKEQLNKGKVEVHLHIKGKRKISTVWTVVGKLRGLTDDTIIVGSHYCSAFEGAICDTVGVVGTLELAQRFSKIPIQKRRNTMLFIFSGSHVWLNCNVSSLKFIKNHYKIMPKVVAMLWMDHLSAPFVEGKSRIDFPTRLAITSDNLIMWFLTVLAMLKNKRIPLVLPLNRIWSLCEMGAFDNIGVPCMTTQVSSDFMLTTEDTWDKINPTQLHRDIGVFYFLARLIQRIPGRLLQLFEFPGRSFFGCGVLFKDTSVPQYPKGELYGVEKSPPLYLGGENRIITIIKDNNTEK
ncbi:MAG: hypothetical protein GY870_04060 [archaeon]|nr:hypothetical protein [archaeon]